MVLKFSGQVHLPCLDNSTVTMTEVSVSGLKLAESLVVKFPSSQTAEELCLCLTMSRSSFNDSHVANRRIIF